MRLFRRLLRESLGDEGDKLDSHLRAIHRDMEDAGVEYTYVGGMSLRPHNYRRYTEDVDMIVSKQSLPKIEEHLIGRGYTRRVGSAHNMHYTHASPKIPIDVLVEGQDNQGHKVPHPVEIRTMINGVYHPKLHHLIDLKLKAGRGRDIEDVRELSKANKLDQSFAEKLHPDVRGKFNSILKEE